MNRKQTRRISLEGVLLGAALALWPPVGWAWGPYAHVAIGREVTLQAQQQGQIDDQFNVSLFLAGCTAPDVFASVEASTADVTGFLGQLVGIQHEQTKTYQRWKAIGSTVFHGSGETLAQALLEKAGTDADLRAFALGWMTHIQADLALEESEKAENEGLNLNGTKILKALYDSVSAQGLSDAITPGKWPYIPWLTEIFQGNSKYSQLVVQTCRAAGRTDLSAADLEQAAQLNVETQKAIWQVGVRRPPMFGRHAMNFFPFHLKNRCGCGIESTSQGT